MKKFWKSNRDMQEDKKKEEKFASLYNIEYAHFVYYVIKRSDNNLILEESNQKISGFIIDIGLEVEDIIGMQRWLDGFSRDLNVYNLNNKTIDVRETTEQIFQKQINRIYSIRYKTKNGVVIPNEIFEAVFLRNSIDVGLRKLFPGVL